MGPLRRASGLAGGQGKQGRQGNSRRVREQPDWPVNNTEQRSTARHARNRADFLPPPPLPPPPRMLPPDSVGLGRAAVGEAGRLRMHACLPLCDPW
jgi:hypothetical protein